LSREKVLYLYLSNLANNSDLWIWENNLPHAAQLINQFSGK